MSVDVLVEATINLSMRYRVISSVWLSVLLPGTVSTLCSKCFVVLRSVALRSVYHEASRQCLGGGGHGVWDESWTVSTLYARLKLRIVEIRMETWLWLGGNLAR